MRPLALYLGLLLAPLSPEQDSIASRFVRLREPGLTDCLSETLPSDRAASNAVVIRQFRTTRQLPDDKTAGAVLVALLDYTLRPSPSTFDALRRRHIQSGAHAAVAEDISRCAYFKNDHSPEQAQRLASIPPVKIGFFWAGRVLHESGHEGDALSYYQRALDADDTDPRTRILYGIALLEEQRAPDALAMFEGIREGWAPNVTSYWRARALLAVGRVREARAALERLPEEIAPEVTVPDAWTNAGPVQPGSTRCALGEALAADGEETRGRDLLGTRDCSAELAALELHMDRPFEALVATKTFLGGRRVTGLRVDALVRLRACDWARRDLRELEGRGWDTLRSQVASRCPESDALVDPMPLDSAMAARLAAPRLVPFAERSIPSAWRWKGPRPEDPPAPPFRGLEPYAVVAVSPSADRMFAVSVSQDVDPRGEVSSGGYWLHLSFDRGQHWEGPYYLGFVEQYPYVVQTVSRMPAFSGNHAQIEVERREVDESSITFPPTGLRAKNVETNLVLDVDLDAVRRDSDGDGLTDLLEEKLLLDPRVRDTDADGLDDGDDPLPLTPRAADDLGENGRLWMVLVPGIFGGPAPIQQSAAPGNESSVMSRQALPFASERTLFLEAARCPVPHAARIRTICLSSELMKRYRVKFGATYPMEMPDIAYDRDRQRVLISYSLGWRGGVLVAVWKDGDLSIEEIVSWIT